MRLVVLACLAVAAAAGCGPSRAVGLELGEAGSSPVAGGGAGSGVGPLAGMAGTAGVSPPCTAPGDGTCSPSRPVFTCDVNNARDLGGMPLAPSGTVACGQVFRGPPLAGLTKSGCEEAKSLGIRTVIDLRVETERLSLPDDACAGEKLVFAPLPVPYQVSPANYLADFDAKDSMARIFHTLGDPAAYPIYFHCTYGRDRTGVVAAALLLALGASRAEIMREYLLSKATVGAYPDSLTAVLDEIERRGGIEPSLKAAGVTDADLAALRAQAIAP